MTRDLWLAAWAAVAALGVTAEVASLVTHGRRPGALQSLRALTWGNVRLVVVFLAWMWLGWHLFAR